ncbi:hypothetical protein SAMN05444266_103205 [Chitinophaga jiangningensis]|uniref:Four helix bundle sensory module for signal transduction n=1 Tax=Chitinophaga jiangningensis TaxID=1419482 RepID=A0A1M7AAY7_9BACT|nr:hypothetical protein [Chitinophaga jiangningensis]SHL39893.1 hypothetical protein SAMN05444266_103205 [Chitinophaga jiangningensis]
MKTARLYRVVLLVLLTMPLLTHAQQVQTATDSLSLRAYLLSRGDTLTLGYDSAYLLNKRIFKLYADNYQKVLKGNLASQRIIEAYDSLVVLQDSMLKRKDFYYTQLKGSFDGLQGATDVFIKRTDANLVGLNQSLAAANTHLQNVQTSLDASLEKLKTQNKQKVKLAIGGFAIGIALTSLIFLVAN